MEKLIEENSEFLAEVDAPGECTSKNINGKVCVHHWKIESPNGPYSKGICKYCQEEKMFSNNTSYKGWDGVDYNKQKRKRKNSDFN